MRKVLLDTNAYSYLLRGDQDIAKQMAEADLVYMSVFVVAELLTGFKGGVKEKSNRHILDKFIKKHSVTLLLAGKETAEIFSTVKYSLKSAGTPIPINDVWIASHTIETGAVLLTYDHHFKAVAGLRVWENLE